MAAPKAATDLAKSYLVNIRREIETGSATEHTYRAALKEFIEVLGTGVTAINEPKREACGAPDFVVRKSALSIGYIEAKDIGKSLDEAEDSEQLGRYRKSLHNLILTDYLEFRWYVDGDLREKTKLARLGKGNKIIPEKDGIEKTTAILSDFLSHNPAPITNPKELSQRLARLAHIIRDIIVEAFDREKASDDLKDLRKAFAQVLIPDLSQPEKTADFADMYAQTIVYGLFAARVNHRGPEQFQRQGAAREIPKTNPFLKKLFEIITGSELDDEPYVDFVEDLAHMLANTDMEKVLEDFGKRTQQEDPMVHFYETFLEAYDPDLREKRGVFFTPAPPVSYIVRSVDHILKSFFGLEGGLAHTSDVIKYDRVEPFFDKNGNPDRSKLLNTKDEERPKVLILDPACGTGTFLYSVMDHIRAEFMKRGDAGLWSDYVRDHLLPRLFGFELLMAPYAVAHFKIGMLLAAYDLPTEQQKIWQYRFEGDERLEIYLTNTLEEAPIKMAEALWGLRILSEEANAASRVKRDLPVMVVLGNPPYSNFGMMNKNKFILDLLRDYKKGLNEKKLNLDDDFIKFIRWAQWRIERTGYGVLAFITNNTYIDGIAHRQMRKSLIDTFDEIYILDLHGSKKRLEKCPDGSKDENIFDIQQGVAIGIFVKEKAKRDLTKVYHSELWGMRESKYAYLSDKDIATTKWTKLDPSFPHYFLVPKNFSVEAEYSTGWYINDIFPLSQNGLKTDRDSLFFDQDREVLENRIRTLYSDAGMDSSFREKYQIMDSSSYKLMSKRLRIAFNLENIHLCLYRPFDSYWLYYAPGLTSRPAWDVMRQMLAGKKNISLISGRASQAIGSDDWDLVSCSNILIDTNLFRRGGNIVAPLYEYATSKIDNARQNQLAGSAPYRFSPAGRAPNLSPDFIATLEQYLGLSFLTDGCGDLNSTFGPEDVFHYIYAIFHSPTYRKRYAEFLKMDFPRVPLTYDTQLFRHLCTLGKELVSLHLLESPKLDVTRFLTHYPVTGDNFVEKGFPKYVTYENNGPGYVFINKTQ